MKKFLENHPQSIHLDKEHYQSYFKNSNRSTTKRNADLLLLDKKIVCEYKELQSIKIKEHVENFSRTLSKNDSLSFRSSKNKVHKRVKKDLSDANEQISFTVEALSRAELIKEDVLRLVIVENQIADDYSIQPCLYEVNRIMSQESRLSNIDCVFCLDVTNTYLSDGKPFFMSQMICRDTDRARRLYSSFGKLFQEYCEQTTLNNDIALDFVSPKHELESSYHCWNVNEDGSYMSFEGELKFHESDAVKGNILKSVRYFWEKWSRPIWAIIIFLAIIDILLIP